MTTTAIKPARARQPKTTTRQKIGKWAKAGTKRPKEPTLAELNRRLFADPERLLRIAEANTLKLTGRTRL